MASDNAGYEIKVLGGFEVRCGGRTVISKSSRHSKVVRLCEYLVCARPRAVGLDELADVILKGGTSDSASVLKNLVYRLRSLFEAAGADGSCIVYTRKAYAFEPKLPCSLDIERFYELCDGLARRRNASVEDYAEALGLCRGRFLPRSENEEWVKKSSEEYEKRYIGLLRAAKKAAGDDASQGRLLLTYLRTAAKLFPFSEDARLLLIEALYKYEDAHAALTEYADAVELFYGGLAEKPGTRFLELYEKISGGLHSPLEAVTEFRDSLFDAQDAGALYCLPETFKSVIAVTQRDVARSGRSVFLMLCTARERGGDAPKPGAREKKVTVALRRAISESLRRSDAFTRYSANQFIIMLTAIDRASCRLVVERLRRNFSKLPGVSGVRLEFDYVVA